MSDQRFTVAAFAALSTAAEKRAFVEAAVKDSVGRVRGIGTHIDPAGRPLRRPRRSVRGPGVLRDGEGPARAQVASVARHRMRGSDAQ